ncbi:HlyD family secretion protein [Chitinophaga nivalis]|uniref:HlyD family secretion protein n=1 Tax=Chitinophaga nivalis TaxID=2991709 RepID=A0ABT3II64_9BACT|nr:HlyD family secretion protein [Chitinophaga nivalis]MCW3466663.1 HlyD family secretion protein [Chitinophaga nivalis]MCW3483646.1 HlyD family secretion protein [Chitinophaga nivalis]
MNNKNLNKTDKVILGTTRGVAIAALCGLALWGGKVIWDMLRYEQTNDAQVEAYVNPVNVKVGGYIKKIYFQENQLVNPGDTLLLIENNEYDLSLHASRAALEHARAQLAILGANEATLLNNAAVSQSQIDAAKAKLVRQQQEYTRYQNLLKEESTTQQQFDNVKAALDIAEAEYQSVLHTHKTSLSKVNDVKVQRAAVDADIKRQEYLLERNALDMGYTVVTAPYKGRIGRKNIQEGQLVQAGQTMTFIINEAAGKWIIANFRETQVSGFAPGQKAIIQVDAFPDMHFNGEIESISPATGSRFSLVPPDNSTGNFVKIIQRVPVKIRLTDGYDKLAVLLAGMNANVSINK